MSNAAHGVAAALLFLLGGCSPAFTDGMWEIDGAPGYFFSDTGGDGTAILKEGREGLVIFIDARVNGYFVSKGKLFVSRSPRTLIQDERGVLQSKVAENCEFLEVDMGSHTIRRMHEAIPGLSCPPPEVEGKKRDWILRK